MYIKVITDEKIKDCSMCPLAYGYKRDCGKEISENVNGGQVFKKKPDRRCKIQSRK